MSALLLVAVFAALLILGVPIAFAVGSAAAVSLATSIELLPALATVAQRIATGLDSFSLLAIPLFILSGQLMNRGGAAHRLIGLGRELVGPLPGGIVFVNVVGCLLFGAVSGSAVATAAGVGAFMIPLMEKEGFSRETGAAVNITASTTGLLVPPSNILIVYSLASGGVSIAALFLAGYVPGILVGLCIAVAAVLTSGRGLRRTDSWSPSELLRALLAALPSLVLVVIVMGGIVGGVFTATEAAAIAVAYSLVLGVVVYRELRLAELPQILTEAATTTGMVMLLIGASMAMSWVMAYDNIPQAVSAALLDIAAGPIAVLLVMNVLLLLVGTFMDMTPAVLIFTPIFLPVALELGVDPVHFGIVMVLNLCVGLCTPPVGTVLFVGCGVAGIELRRVIPALLPLYAAMVAALVLVTLVPEISLALPRAFGFVASP